MPVSYHWGRTVRDPVTAPSTSRLGWSGSPPRARSFASRRSERRVVCVAGATRKADGAPWCTARLRARTRRILQKTSARIAVAVMMGATIAATIPAATPVFPRERALLTPATGRTMGRSRRCLAGNVMSDTGEASSSRAYVLGTGA